MQRPRVSVFASVRLASRRPASRRPASRISLAAVALVALAGCGRTELFGSRGHCAATDVACQMAIDAGTGPRVDGGGAGTAGFGGPGEAGFGGPGAAGFGGPGVAGFGGSGAGGAAGFGAAGASGMGGAAGLPLTCAQMPEICGNGKDDNCNGLADCADPSCFGDPSCTKPGEEICNNGIDDDDDGLIDCADPDCATSISCKPTMGHEICDNGKDDNCDGLVDCADPQCTTFPGCLTVACAADVDFGTLASHGASVTRTIDTTGATRAFTTCATTGANGRDASFVLTAPPDVSLDITQTIGAAHAVALFRAGARRDVRSQPRNVRQRGRQREGDPDLRGPRRRHVLAHRRVVSRDAGRDDGDAVDGHDDDARDLRQRHRR